MERKSSIYSLFEVRIRNYAITYNFKKTWVPKFGSYSYSVATQQVNRIVISMCARWQ